MFQNIQIDVNKGSLSPKGTIQMLIIDLKVFTHDVPSVVELTRKA